MRATVALHAHTVTQCGAVRPTDARPNIPTPSMAPTWHAILHPRVCAQVWVEISPQVLAALDTEPLAPLSQVPGGEGALQNTRVHAQTPTARWHARRGEPSPHVHLCIATDVEALCRRVGPTSTVC